MRSSDWSSDVCSSDLLLTPERSMAVQRSLGSDIVMAFDECTPFPATHEQAASSMERSMRWARRSREGLDRKSVVSGKSVSVRVDLGGRRRIHKKIHSTCTNRRANITANAPTHN